MNFRAIFSLATVGSVAAVRSFVTPGASVSASSAAGRRLLSKARRLDQDEYDFTWAADYALQFHSCHNTFEFRPDGGGASNDEADGAPTEVNRMVLFKLCPADKCGGSCKGGEYLVEMREFVESYLDSKESAREYACEQVKENCSCDDDDAVNDDELCLSQCYAAAGLEGCEDDNNDDNYEFEVNDYLECEAIAEYDDDYATSVYVGAHCSSNGKGIHLGAFSDRQCTKKAAKGAYESLVGRELPYSSESLVANDCIACADAQNEDDDGVQVLEFCEDVYERSAKCEKHLNVDGAVTGGCEYIHKILPRMEALANGKAPTSTVLAWLFGVTTLATSGAAYYFFAKAQRSEVQLSSQGGDLA